MWNLRLRETELSKITQKAGDPIKSKGAWLQNASLMVEVQTPCQGCCLLNGSSVVCFSASFQIILSPPLFHAAAPLSPRICWGFREGRDSALLLLPSPICGLHECQPPPNHHSFFQGQSYGPRERSVPPE